MEVTYFGHSAFLIKLEGGTLLFDPFISENPLSKGRVNIADIKADAILVSHGHFDHTGDAVAIAKQNNAPIIANVEVANWFGKQDAKTIELNFGGKKDLGFATVRMVSALHSSAMPDGSYGGNPAGFIIEHKGGTFYFSGDTGLSAEMQLIAARYKPTLAFLCMGDTYTMGADDAVHAAQIMNIGHVVGMHYDTWPPIALDKDKTQDLFRQADIRLDLLQLHTPVKI